MEKKENVQKTTTTRTRHRGTMNNASEIEKRCKEIDPMACFGASALVFPDKISTVRGVMGTRHTSQRVVLTNP